MNTLTSFGNSDKLSAVITGRTFDEPVRRGCVEQPSEVGAAVESVNGGEESRAPLRRGLLLYSKLVPNVPINTGAWSRKDKHG